MFEGKTMPILKKTSLKPHFFFLALGFLIGAMFSWALQGQNMANAQSDDFASRVHGVLAQCTVYVYVDVEVETEGGYGVGSGDGYGEIEC